MRFLRKFEETTDMSKFRVLISAFLAVAVTFGLFLFMHKLVSSGAGDRDDLEAIAGIHFEPVEIPDTPDA